VAIAAIKGQKTANELASAYEIHVSPINDWKKAWREPPRSRSIAARSSWRPEGGRGGLRGDNA